MIENRNPYILLTPGPLTTSPTVKETMLQDWCTWDNDYNLHIVQKIREKLVKLATESHSEFTSILMQGSGTFAVEALVGSTIPNSGKLLVLENGAYGKRITKIAQRLQIPHLSHEFDELNIPDPQTVEKILIENPTITHLIMVHCETTSGILNNIQSIGKIAKKHQKVFLVDAMSSFAGIPMDIDELNIDFMVSSANKCIQGVPGFGFVIARRSLFEQTKGIARSLSLDLFDQWETMEKHHGKWRYTSPTHTVRAFMQALLELEEEGGVEARHHRYRENHRILVQGMEALGFKCMINQELQSPIITSFFNPETPDYNFGRFYQDIKNKGFVIYPGKVSNADSFRIGTIGHVFPDDFQRLLKAIENSMFWKSSALT